MQVVIKELYASKFGHRLFTAGGTDYITFGGLCMTIQQTLNELCMASFRSL